MHTISNARNRVLLCFSLLPSFSFMYGMVIKEKHLLLPDKHKVSRVYYNEKGFHVVKNNKTRDVKSCDVSRDIRHRSSEELRAYLKTGFLELKRMSDKNYKIEAHQRGLGGGPVLGVCTVITGTLVTAVAAGGAAVGGFCVGGPVGAAAAAAVTAKAGMAATVYATVAATSAPTL